MIKITKYTVLVQGRYSSVSVLARHAESADQQDAHIQCQRQRGCAGRAQSDDMRHASQHLRQHMKVFITSRCCVQSERGAPTNRALHNLRWSPEVELPMQRVGARGLAQKALVLHLLPDNAA